ncbi:hypothetical protein N7509_000252 [Penicillium cosmopolitanum]|uniref:NmrA-like domain-containing protein n=1 Tax=Penicillium cosmopolitanum TaxID=1131564 RepID=A0A9W9WA23_9EURO|nr:uncharacterized protein N7509_000252 [Penicillium cosmopolitanum]KAJ5413625.1 hypothetical protein N7509_000252 [Penicillium cosmopolitanum]
MSDNIVLVIGGTGAQGRPVVKVRVLARNASSKEATELAAIPGVIIFEGETYHEPTLRKALRDVSYVFANTNGLAIGEKAEIYWGIRLYELAREFRVKHFLYAGLEYASKLGNFDPKYRTGNLDGKGKVVDFISHQPTAPMAWSILTSCPYMEGLSEFMRPLPDPHDPGTMVFTAPLGNGKCPLIYLEDYGQYSQWMFDNLTKSRGLELHVGTEDIAWKDLAAVFTTVTGINAAYKDVTLDEYFQLGIWPDANAILGYSAGYDDGSFMTVRKNFSGFWNTWKDNLTKRDYQLLDEILPTRVKSVKEWMVKTGYRGNYASVLKSRRGVIEKEV